MPTIDSLMEVWPQEFEELVKEVCVRLSMLIQERLVIFYSDFKVSLPSSDLNVDLPTFIDIIAALLDVPVYKSRIQSVHLIFNLFSEFKNSEVCALS